MIEFKEFLQERSALNSVTGCIEWTAGLSGSGYGRFQKGSRSKGTNRTYLAHRVSYQIHNGEIPEGLLICHKCDNPKCINPDHLFAGTYSENMQDMKKKGRDNYPKASRCTQAKLTNDQALDILSDKRKYDEIAQDHGVSKYVISDIKTGRGWSSVTGVKYVKKFHNLTKEKKS